MTGPLVTYQYRGVDRVIFGRLHYPEAPDPGSLIGPGRFGDIFVVLGTEDVDGRAMTYLGRPLGTDWANMVDRALTTETASVYEHRADIPPSFTS